MAGGQLGPNVTVAWVWTSQGPRAGLGSPEEIGEALGRSGQPRDGAHGPGEARKDLRLSTSLMQHHMDPRLWELSEFSRR